MAINLDVNVLKALVLFASNEQSRYYLCGVNVKVAPGKAQLAATDGHKAMVANLAQEDNQEALSLIIPSETIKTAIKGQKYAVELARVNNTQWRLGAAIFTPIDGTFPDYERIIPRTISKEIAHFDAEYIGVIGKADKALGGNAQINIGHNGEAPALVSSEAMRDKNAFVVIMPLRAENVDWAETVNAVMGKDFMTLYPPVKQAAE